MEFWNSIKQTSRSNCSDATIWLIFTLVGNLAPLWIGFLLLRIFSRNPTITDFSAHGEFALYSATMAAPALYIIIRDVRVSRFPGQITLVLLCVVEMLLATVFYAPVATALVLRTPVSAIDQEFVWIGTFILFVFSCLVAFLVTVLDNSLLAPDVRRIAADQRAQLATDFEKLGGGQ
jgi:hypothetical protein